MSIIKFDKFNTSFTMFLWVNWHVRTWNQNFIRLDVRSRREKPFNTSFKYRRFRIYRQKSMLTAIPSQIIKLMSTYSRKTHEYGNCNKSSTSRASPSLVKSAIESADVPIKWFNLLFFSIENLYLLLTIILMYIWVPIALSFRFFYSSSVWLVSRAFTPLKCHTSRVLG